MSFVRGYYVRNRKKHSWIFKRFFLTKKLMKDYLRRFWKEKDSGDLEFGKGEFWYDN